ncbi:MULTISPECIES: discoidin domain-containing protein [Bacteroides]|jgi:hypothetical protein|uniref:F5/8 type C domain-containing protein n=1 Tax=Bacteroides clarus TaxID=626929 RepID=A0A1Y3YSR6_9BACE|nr:MULTISPECIES: discoidin domain-containing protein [Bacteroides]MBD9144560.1 discoidin domain-containing protein [Bacteroides clarus]MBS1306715.1 discoidin domain-containing protein [Bacteroides sp.]OUO00923.1 hypothetical protein B5F97_10410 [Bacteroides clarus]CDB82668.1 uncharacterized protein BN507_02609 [Bacteroides clarus CAG:160]
MKKIIFAAFGLFLMSAYAQAQENLALNKTITASSEWARPANYGPDKAVDGDNKTRWSAIKGAAESWLQIDFGEKTKFSKVVVNGDYADRVAKYSIEVSDDGEKWKPVVKEVERECNQSKSSVWEATFKSVKKRYVRLFIHSSVSNGNPCEASICELEVY